MWRDRHPCSVIPVATRYPGGYRGAMSGYRRPDFTREIHRDGQGAPIAYGHRWEGTSPPSRAYSTVGHRHRFIPLHEVADALIDWLLGAFDVVVEREPEVASDLLFPSEDVVRAVRVVPSILFAAPVTFVFTGFPGIFLHAGALYDAHYPVCGCDACDDDVPELLENLESVVRAVISGCFFERISPTDDQSVDYRLAEPGRWEEAGCIQAEDVPEGRMETAEAMLPSDGHWLPWPEAMRDAAGAAGG